MLLLSNNKSRCSKVCKTITTLSKKKEKKSVHLLRDRLTLSLILQIRYFNSSYYCIIVRDNLADLPLSQISIFYAKSNNFNKTILRYLVTIFANLRAKLSKRWQENSSRFEKKKSNRIGINSSSRDNKVTLHTPRKWKLYTNNLSLDKIIKPYRSRQINF